MRKFHMLAMAAAVAVFAIPAIASEGAPADPAATWDLTELYPTV